MSFPSIERALRTLVGVNNETEKEDIIQAIKSLDNNLAQKRNELPKKLVHFLEKRSYHKALGFIQSAEKHE